MINPFILKEAVASVNMHNNTERITWTLAEELESERNEPMLEPIVDVSKWQGEIDWSVMSTKVYGAIIKATQARATLDSQFFRNWEQAGDYDVPRGAYHFFKAEKKTTSARKQAEWFWSMAVEPAGADAELGYWLDIERNDEDLSKNEYQGQIWKFINTFKELSGFDVDIYTSASKWDQFVAPYPGNTDIPRNRKLWVANYYVNYPSIPFDWKKRYGYDCWTLWQHTPKGDGLAYGAQSRSLDMNRFNGSLDEYNKVFDLAVPPPIEPPPDPQPEPEEDTCTIRITGLQGATLNMRDKVWGDRVAYTWNDAEFEVMGWYYDTQNRLWYQIGETIWVAGWYTEKVD